MCLFCGCFCYTWPLIMQAELRDVGLCHYMAVLRKKSSKMGSHGQEGSNHSGRGMQRGWDHKSGMGSSEDHAGETNEDLIQFDFGPRGFDITFHNSSRRGTPRASATRSSRTSELALASLGTRFAAPDGSRPHRRQRVPEKEASMCPLSFAGACNPAEIFEALRVPNGEVRQERVSTCDVSHKGLAALASDTWARASCSFDSLLKENQGSFTS